MPQTSSSNQTHTGTDIAKSVRVATQTQNKIANGVNESKGSKSSAAKAISRRAGSSVKKQTQLTAARSTTQTRVGTTATTERTTPASESKVTTYDDVGVNFTLAITIQLGGQPKPVTLKI